MTDENKMVSEEDQSQHFNIGHLPEAMNYCHAILSSVEDLLVDHLGVLHADQVDEVEEVSSKLADIYQALGHSLYVMESEQEVSTETVKVVINAGEGSFGLSKAAVDWLVDKGHQASIDHLKEYEEMLKDNWFGGPPMNDQKRANPLLVEMVEQLGEKAGEPEASAHLVVVEIPADIEWGVNMPDFGPEHIYEKHKTWQA